MNTENKRAAKPAAKQTQVRRAPSKSARAAALRRKQQNRQLIILSVALALIVIAIATILIIKLASPGDKTQTGKQDVNTAGTDVVSPDNGEDNTVSGIVTGPEDDESDFPFDGQSAGISGLIVPAVDLGDTYSAEEYLRAINPGAEPRPAKYLDVTERGPVNTKRIAITVDDLNEVNNLNTILSIANQYNGKLTLFAIGSVIDTKSTLRQTLKDAYNMGHEIENHTYDHAKLFSMSDADMAFQVYETQKAVNNALGVEYEMHFLRMPGGNGENDLRSHQYLLQLNEMGLADYKEVAHWTFSGSNGTIAEIEKSLKPGYVYLFHCKDADLKKLEEFIPYAVSQGYELVTLNELLGYPENSVRALKGDAKSYVIPEPYPFVYTDFVLMDGKAHSHNGKLYVVQLLQSRLIELGYLSSSAVVDGDFGNDTTIAVKLFQYYNDLHMDGQAGPQTQTVLFSSAAKRNPSTYIAGQPETYPSDAEKRDMFTN